MAEFKCKNCGIVFNKFCDTVLDSINVECPKCGSHWVKLYINIPEDERQVSPKKLPYTDPLWHQVKYLYKDIKPLTTPWSIGW